MLAATFSLISVLLTFLLGRRLYGEKVGLLAALLLGFAALPIQQAHFFTVDAFADTFVVLGSVVRGLDLRARAHAQLRRVRSRAGRGDGVQAQPAAAGLDRGGRGDRRPARARSPRGTGRAAVGWSPRSPISRWRASSSFVVFRLLQPYAFAGPGIFGLSINPAWWANMQEIRESMSGARDMPPGHQWTDRLPIWFPWRNIVVWGLGTPLGLAAWIGWAVAGFELIRRKRYVHLVPWTWVLILFGQQGMQWVKSLRYFLPIYPALALFAALLVVETGRRLRRDAAAGAAGAPPVPAWRRWAATALAVIVVGGAAAWAWAFTSIYRRPHSRIDASEWIYDNVPPGAAIGFEVWDDPLPLRTGGRDAGSIYRGVELHNYAEDDPEKLDLTLDALSRTNVMVLSSNRLYDSIPRLPMRYPMMVRYYQHLFAGDLGFKRVAEFTSYPRLFGFDFPDQKAEEAWSVYDHPRVQIFVRTPEWDVEKARALLDSAGLGRHRSAVAARGEALPHADDGSGARARAARGWHLARRRAGRGRARRTVLAGRLRQSPSGGDLDGGARDPRPGRVPTLLRGLRSVRRSRLDDGEDGGPAAGRVGRLGAGVDALAALEPRHAVGAGGGAGRSVARDRMARAPPPGRLRRRAVAHDRARGARVLVLLRVPALVPLSQSRSVARGARR